MVSEIPTSEVVTRSMLVLYVSKISKTLPNQPFCNSILLDTILMAVMLSLAATALMVP